MDARPPAILTTASHPRNSAWGTLKIKHPVARQTIGWPPSIDKTPLVPLSNLPEVTPGPIPPA
jgi:hypothetical protein